LSSLKHSGTTVPACDRKSHMDFPFAPKVVTLNDLYLRNGHYFVSFHPKL